MNQQHLPTMRAKQALLALTVGIFVFLC